MEPRRKKQMWTKEEDAELRRLFGALEGNSWQSIARHLPGRSGKQCRERWLNHLDPSIRKGVWTAEEDATITLLRARMGNCWRAIAAQLPGRTDHAVKNRWNSTLNPLRRQSQSSASAEAPPAQMYSHESKSNLTDTTNGRVAASSTVSTGRTDAFKRHNDIRFRQNGAADKLKDMRYMEGPALPTANSYKQATNHLPPPTIEPIWWLDGSETLSNALIDAKDTTMYSRANDGVGVDEANAAEDTLTEVSMSQL